MYAIALIRYRRPLEEVIVHQEPHRAYQRELKAKGVLIASGPCNLDAVRDGDPFVQAGVAQYELLAWAPVIGKDDLDKL
jgi:uncharacterized protein YciI